MANSYNMLSDNTSVFRPICSSCLILFYRYFKHIAPTFGVCSSLFCSSQPFRIFCKVIDSKKTIDSLLTGFTVDSLRIVYHTSHIEISFMNISIRKLCSFQSSCLITFIIGGDIKLYQITNSANSQKLILITCRMFTTYNTERVIFQIVTTIRILISHQEFTKLLTGIQP